LLGKVFSNQKVLNFRNNSELKLLDELIQGFMMIQSKCSPGISGSYSPLLGAKKKLR
jgi:hypothetical protein